MKIRLNGETAHIKGPITLGDLVREKKLDPEAIVVEHNRAIVATGDFDRITLNENDSLEILRFVGGG